ncbi:MAG: hypothetical protein LKJ83_01315 [Eubacteriaceae bacterium]|jgi:hypothetical protein|nr:hypothetical protein [Eubacteriaceae bacterium]
MVNRNITNRDIISLDDAIEGFLDSKRDLPTSSDQDSAGNILRGKNGDKFLEYYGESGTSKDNPIEELAFADAVEAFVRGYTRDKDMQRIKYLNDRLHDHDGITYLPRNGNSWKLHIFDKSTYYEVARL